MSDTHTILFRYTLTPGNCESLATKIERRKRISKESFITILASSWKFYYDLVNNTFISTWFKSFQRIPYRTQNTCSQYDAAIR